ncbi:hypothetical protein HG531_002870 [Fusarium graminearum]|nr:hypothetical protein HG531_002870 [Fusarium graminearum]
MTSPDTNVAVGNSGCLSTRATIGCGDGGIGDLLDAEVLADESILGLIDIEHLNTNCQRLEKEHLILDPSLRVGNVCIGSHRFAIGGLLVGLGLGALRICDLGLCIAVGPLVHTNKVIHKLGIVGHENLCAARVGVKHLLDQV